MKNYWLDKNRQYIPVTRVFEGDIVVDYCVWPQAKEIGQAFIYRQGLEGVATSIVKEVRTYGDMIYYLMDNGDLVSSEYILYV